MPWLIVGAAPPLHAGLLLSRRAHRHLMQPAVRCHRARLLRERLPRYAAAAAPLTDHLHKMLPAGHCHTLHPGHLRLPRYSAAAAPLTHDLDMMLPAEHCHKICWNVAERVVSRAEVLHICAFNAEHSRRFKEAFVYMFAVPHQVGKLQGHDYHKYYCNSIVF